MTILKMTPWNLGKPIFYEASLTQVPQLDEFETSSLPKPDEVRQTTFLAVEQRHHVDVEIVLSYPTNAIIRQQWFWRLFNGCFLLWNSACWLENVFIWMEKMEFFRDRRKN